MKSTFIDFIKRDLTLWIALSGLVFASALAWGGPFLATNHRSRAAGMTFAQTATLTGLVMRDGRNVYLNLGERKLYQIENVEWVSGFDGKYVTVTGRVNAQAKLIRVERLGR